VLDIVRAASDRSASSVEMLAHARGWAQRYHLDPTRANILRPLAIDPSARVLEIGAGCGAITRYLAERCALVDALEPVPVRAEAAAARTADLAGGPDRAGGARVFVGELDDVPDAAGYDLVVVIGVLEYVGRGSADSAPYLRFLLGIVAPRARRGVAMR
jgi:cyclopropane fatty-acyl-phospholipid synthase-like methyltransferase